MAKKLTSTKAKKILHDKEVHGHPLTEQQRKFFGAIAGGAKPYKVESGGWLDKFDAPQAQNGIEGTMGGLTDKGFNFNPAWGGAWRDGGDLPKYQTGDTFTPYSRDYLTNFRDEWVKSYNQPIPYALPTDDRFDKFYLEKRATVPEYYETKSGWVRGLGTGMEEYREGDKNTPPKSMGKLAKGYEWVENYRTGPFRDDSQIREYTRLIKSIRNAESRKPVWNRDVKFNFKSGGILQPPMAGANQTVPMAQKGIRQPIYTSDPRDPRLRSYQDSLNLYKAYQMQDKLMGPGSETSKYNIEWTTDELKKGRVKKIVKGLEEFGPISKDFQSEKDQFEGGFNDFSSRREDKKLIDYYKSLGFGPNQIMYHSSPDVVSDKIRAIGTYFDGTANSPIYKKPVQPVEYKKRVLEKPNLSVDLPNIELTDVRPTITQPTFEQARVDMSKPTKYSYTYPTFDKDVQKTMYFPDRNSWKTFVEQQRFTSSQEGKDYGSATGQFAMGGSLPGSVGFTYARTQSPAPANGPYAKKTKASAQNGQEMKFYQEGLDFTPKTISKNGGWLDKYDVPQAQTGKMLEYLKSKKTAPVVTKGEPMSEEMQKRITTETLRRQTQKNKPLTATNTREQAVERGRAENLRVIEENKEYDRQAMAEGKAAEATRENPNVPFTFPTGESKLWKDMDWREQQYVSGRNLGSMSRSNNWTDWINPITMFGEMGEGLATAPYMARETDSNLPYIAGIVSPLLTGALGGAGTRSTGQFANNMLNPVAGMDLSFNKIGKKITNAMLSPFSKSTQSAIKSFNRGLDRGIGDVLSGRPISETFPITKKQVQLAKQKATQEHTQGARFARDWYYDSKGAIRPEVEQKIESILKSKGAPLENYPYYSNYKTSGTSSYKSTDPITGIDSYRFITNPFADSPDVVVGSSTKSILESGLSDDAKKYLLEERHKIGGVNFVNAYGPGPSMTLFGQGPHYFRPSSVGDIGAHEAGHTAQNLGGISYDPRTGVPYHGYKKDTWGEVTTSTSPDYEYYIPNPTTELGQRFGKAMIEPEKGKYTWEASPNELHSDLMIARRRTHENLMKQGLDYQTAINKIQKETMTDDAMVDELIRQGSLNRFFKKDTPIEEKRALIRLLPAAVPAVGAASMLGGESEESPKRAFQYGGDIPIDPMGYWNPENVGSPVIIPSNVITMEGVDQPLVGVSDTGDVQYMMPGEDYEFDGEYVTEYPVAKKGISVNNADAQPLKKLDQLLNFTNYNKPTKGGWLDKYN
jgi:hypothetical protein